MESARITRYGFCQFLILRASRYLAWSAAGMDSIRDVASDSEEADACCDREHAASEMVAMAQRRRDRWRIVLELTSAWLVCDRARFRVQTAFLSEDDTTRCPKGNASRAHRRDRPARPR